MNRLGHKATYLPIRQDASDHIATLRFRLLLGLLIIGAIAVLMAPASVVSLIAGASTVFQSSKMPAVTAADTSQRVGSDSFSPGFGDVRN